MTKEEIQEFMLKFDELKASVLDITQRLEKLESGEVDSGVYLDGCPDYAVDYITNSKKKEGE